MLLTATILLLNGCILESVPERNENHKVVSSINILENVQGVDPEKFYYGQCIYLHGEDGKVKNWQNFDDLKKQNLEALFSETLLTKLDYSKNPNNISDEIYIGPLCDCNQYKRASGLIEQYKLDFQSILAHGTEGLSSCVDFSEFG